MNIDGYDLIGIIGVSISLFCYARVQWRRDYAKEISYSFLNFLSSLLYMLAIFHHWNVAAFISNTVWMLISMYGVYRCLKYYLRKGAA